MPPVVSIIVSHYDTRLEWFEKAIGSILNQTLRDIELLVVDDATPHERWIDALRKFRHDERLSVWRTTRNVGTYRIKNAIFPYTKAPNIAFQDADDWSMNERLELQLRAMYEQRVDVMGCGFRYVDELGDCLASRFLGTRADLLWKLGKGFVALHPTLIVRRHVWEQLGGFDGTARVGADDDFVLRAIHYCRVRNLRKLLYAYRRHPRCVTLDAETGFASELRCEYLRRVKARDRARWRVGRWLSCATPASLLAPSNNVQFALQRVQV